MWANAEVARFCRWLRAWNVERPEGQRAGFHGLDVYSLWESMQAIFDYLGEEDPTSLEAAQDAYRCFEPYGKRVEEYGAASRFVSARCEEEVVRLLARTREQAARRRPGPLLGLAERGGGGGRGALLPGDGGGWPGFLEHPRHPHAGHPGPAAGPLRPGCPRDRLGAQHARRRRPGHRHGRRRDGQHRAVGPGAARRRRGGAGRFRQLPGNGDRRAPLGVAARGDGGATGASGLGGAAAARADAGAGGAGLRRRRPAGLGHRRPPTTGRSGWSTTRSFESWGNYVPTRLGERYDAFIWCDETTALHPLPALATPGEMETYPAGV